jgi:hypothetical protein
MMERAVVPVIVMMLMVVLVPTVMGSVRTSHREVPCTDEATTGQDGPSSGPMPEVPGIRPVEWQAVGTTSSLPEPGLGPILDGARLSDESGAPVKPLDIVLEPEGSTSSSSDGVLIPTRASDLENEKGYYDYANGSLVEVPFEIVTGTLTYAPDDPTDDQRDWYKLRLVDVEPMPSSPNGLHWIRLSLLSYSNGTGGT